MTSSVVFIDSRVPDLQVLLDGLAPGAVAHVLAPSWDGIGQVAEILEAVSVRDLATLVLVGHGRPGAIEIGSGSLDEDGLSGHGPALAQIGAALAPSAKVLLYACDVAHGDVGRRFIAALAGAFGIDVAAASHPVGSPRLGASWTLDAATGPVGSPIPFTPAAQANYAGLLAVRYSLGTYNFGQPANTANLVLGDFNNDGRIDEIYEDTDNVTTDGEHIYVALGNGDGTFQSPILKPDDGTAAYDGTHPFTSGPLTGIDIPGATTMNVYAVDINNDGRTDLINAPNGGTPRVFLNTGSGLSTTATTPFPTQANSGRFVFGDFNGDGFLDVLNQASNTSGTGITLYLGSANGSFTTHFDQPTGAAFTTGPLNGIGFTFISNSIVVADLNGDGTDDIIDSSTANSAPKVYFSSGSGPNATLNLTPVTGLFPSQPTAGRFVVGDFDSDGDIDVLNQLGQNAGQGISLYLNNGNGSFTQISKTDDVTAGDGTGTFTSGPFTGLDLRSIGPTFIRTADVDSDGDLDLVALSATVANRRYFVQGSNSGGNGSPPALASTTPADNATGVAPSANIVLTFDESVSTGTGNIEIVRLSDDTVVQTIAVTSGAITGSGTTWTINPPSDLASGVEYGVRIASGTFVDGDGAVYFGNAATAISFTTQANTPPTLNHDTGLTLAEGGTATITATQLDFNDAEQADTAITYTVTSAATNGTLFRSGVAVGLNGTFTQDDVNNNRVTYIHDGSETTGANFGFSVSDGAGGSVTGQTFGFTVTAVNDAPTLATNAAGALAYAENAAATAIVPGLTLSDPDSANLAGATVAITGGYASGQDVLAFTDGNGITGSFNTTTGVLTLTGSASVAQYEAALRSVTYANTSENPSAATRTISLTATDGGASSLAVTRSIAVSAVNDAPTATLPASLTVTEDVASVLTGISFSDVDAGSGAVRATFTVASGSLSGTTGGNVTVGGSATALILEGTISDINAFIAGSNLRFTTAQDATAPVSLGVSFSDLGNTGTGTAQTTSGTVTLNVTAVDDAPVLATNSVGALAYTENDTATAIVPGLTLSDLDSTNLTGATVAITTGYVSGQDVLAFTSANGITGAYDVATGELSLSGSATLAQYQAALDSVTYANTSDDPSTATRTISITATSDGSATSTAVTRTISVAAVNDAPINTVPASIAIGSSGQGAITGLSIADPDADVGTFTITLALQTGTLTVTSGGAAVTGSGSGLVTLTGTLAAINATLAASGGVTYQNAPGTNDQLTMTTSDGGNTGSGGVLTDIDTVQITVASPPPPPPSPASPTTIGDDNLIGSDGADSVSLLSGNDTYAGGFGDDLVQGNQGNDLLFGNQGDDTLFGGQGQDTLFGGQDQDLLFGDIGDDVVLGNLGADTLFGNRGADTLFGGQGSDLIYGGQGDDVLFGDLGDDVLSGDLGADRYVFGQNSGHDVILSFSQVQGDRIDLQGQSFTFGTAADGSGSALLVLSGGGTIELAGITQAQVNAGFFAT